MSKVLVTGASGAIGEVLVDLLKQEGHQVYCIDSKKVRIENDNYFNAIKDPSEIDVVYHLAGLANVPESWTSPMKFVEVNTLGTNRVLEFCRINKSAINFVSSYMYGKPVYLPTDEKHPVEALNPYALSKKMAEELVQFYGDYFGINYNIVRPFNVFGATKNTKLLIPEIIEKIKKNQNVVVNDLLPLRDYLYVDDFVGFLLKCTTKFCNSVVNVGSQTSYSVEEIVKNCIEIWGNPEVTYGTLDVERKNEISETLCDNSFAKDFFNWKPNYSLKEGLEKMKIQG